ncbi:MAG: DUF4869 domain-containing protein [Alphaproteobacteria bacterium]|nr:DUF4869 domain-containing protein [Alphaproteobacteria bacterium]
MLKLWLYEPKNDEGYIHSAGIFFDAEYEGEWLEEGLIKEMILDVDKSEVISGQLIQSPILGPIPPERLSGGVKTLIMASHDNTRVYNLTSCGDNCAKWVLKLAENQDIVMRLGHYMNFESCEPFQIEILNLNRIVTNYTEFVNAMGDVDDSEEGTTC